MADKLVMHKPSDADKEVLNAALDKASPIFALLLTTFLRHCEQNGLPKKVASAALNHWLFTSLCRVSLLSTDVDPTSIPPDVPNDIGLAMQTYLGELLMDVMTDVRRRESSSN